MNRQPNKRYFKIGFYRHPARMAHTMRGAKGRPMFRIFIFKTTEVEPTEIQYPRKGIDYKGIMWTIKLPVITIRF